MKACDLIGKNAIRTQPVDLGNGMRDHSYTDSPVHIINATDSHVVYEYLPEYDKILAGRTRIMNYRWCDDNWIDFDFLLTPASEQLKTFDDIKLDA